MPPPIAPAPTITYLLIPPTLCGRAFALGEDRRVNIAVTFRDLQPSDLSDLDWAGGSEHLTAIAEVLPLMVADEADYLVGELPNGRLVAAGGADLRPVVEAGLLWQLSVHSLLQGLGIGSALVAELEERIRRRGRTEARLTVEHDNPDAARLYQRLGYREHGSAVESWPVAGGRRYVTVTTVLRKPLSA
jgi:ribosomal protein S18 acetylase RimI-like enzyme